MSVAPEGGRNRIMTPRSAAAGTMVGRARSSSNLKLADEAARSIVTRSGHREHQSPRPRNYRLGEADLKRKLLGRSLFDFEPT
jgi:hypothetical protein